MNIIKNISPRISLVFLYAAIGILWISLSDNVLLYFVKDIEHLSLYQSYKGWAFVLFTTLLLYLILLWYGKILHATMQSRNQTEKKFNLLYEDAPNPYQSLDQEGKIIAVNQKWLDLLGYQRQEIIGRWFKDMLAPQSIATFQKNFPKFKTHGYVKGVEFDMLHKDGHIVPVLLHGQISYDSNHTVIQTHCAFEDISNRRQVEHLNRVLKLIRDVNQSIVRIKNRDELLQESCEILISSDLYQYAWIKITQDHFQKLYYTSKQEDIFDAFKTKISGGWIPSCIHLLDQKNNTYAYIQNTKESCQDCPIKDSDTLQGHAYLLKLQHGNSQYGYLAVYSFDSFDEKEFALLEEVAGDIAYGIFNIETEQILKDKEERYRFVVEATTDGFWDYDILNQKVYYSSRWKEILGYEDEELENTLETWKNRIHPDDKQTILSDFELSQEKGTKHYRNIYRLQHKDGHWVWIESTGQTIYDTSGKAIRMIGSHTDITEQVTYREKLILQAKLLEEKKQELENIINNAPNPIIILEEGGKILMLNQAWIDSSGFSLEDLPTIDAWLNLVYEDAQTRESIKKHITSLYDLTESLDEGEFTFLNKNKDLVTWQFSSAPLGIRDGKRTIIASAMDVTELKHKDEMLIRQSRHAAMGEMIGMIAHQWRQPLSTISMDANNMLLDIALEQLDMSHAENYAHNIMQQTQHLSQTIDDFRNFFKPDKVIVTVKIEEIVEQTLSIVADSLKNNSITLTTSFETDKLVDTYPRELMQVFVNIITNAKDALVLQKKENALISIRVYEDHHYINTTICDNGGGIDEAILPKVFDPYFSTKDEKTGTGLGLYMGKMIIEKHLGGILEVCNNHAGACFTIRLLKNPQRGHENEK
ncbi:PAS domain S-box protein [Sulfurospirillum sp. 1612]|uniref:PAS domain S-box protein n=1 Tax=Sulfurospirillum sp. 1612 TaxID=3094835 RepID=UPI002F9290E3